MKIYITSAINLFIWILSIIFSGATSWLLLNLSVLIGIVGYIYTWKKIKHILIGSGIGIVKLIITYFIARSWWAFSYASLDTTNSSFDIFKLLAPIFIVVSLIEAIIIMTALKKSGQGENT
ncbi:hypothetical protein QQ008_28955 [Fulvivirgaceae bacterium BMA10]|uniref:Uncharacterized protein n=1 Tax=Splendidivirga corallicola TaxID=3051826 RepID=A0ABT8KXB7_9BACT|nr:hypothetical protein [Fulvivirgaceae bacterium BMA10]